MAIKGRIGVVGGGNMGSTLVKGMISSKIAQPDQIVVAEKMPKQGKVIRDELGANLVSHAADLGPVDVLLIAVKPADLAEAAQAAAAAVHPETLVISVAAGVTLGAVARCFPGGQPVVRAMPNTPALVSMGMTAMAPGPHVNESHLKTAREIFEAVGQVVLVEEKHMDAVTGLSGSGPAYVFAFIEALADGGVLSGLDRSTALMLAAHTVGGAAGLVLASGQHPAQLKDMVTSPGGTTIAGLMALEAGAFRGAVMKAVAEATKRSKELGG